MRMTTRVYRRTKALNTSGSNVELFRGRKGTGIRARRRIQRGQAIAHYRFKIYDAEAHRHSAYAILVYSRKGRLYPKLVGDAYPGSLDTPWNDVPFYAQFSNEPGPRQSANAYLDWCTGVSIGALDGFRVGGAMVYTLLATRTIQPGEEILWCYGDDDWPRDWASSCCP